MYSLNEVHPMTLTLNQNIKLIYVHEAETEFAQVQFWSSCGSQAEQDVGEFGMAHFLEHLFARSNWVMDCNLIEKLDSEGGSFDAYTSYDRQVLQFQVPNVDLQTWLQRIVKLIFEAKWTKENIELEKKVVLEELGQANENEDTAREQAVFQELSEKLQFPPEFHRNILGTKNQIENFSKNKVDKFYRDRFLNGLGSLVVLGDLPDAQVGKDLQDFFSRFNTLERNPSALNPSPQPKTQIFEWESLKNENLKRVELIWDVPSQIENWVVVLLAKFLNDFEGPLMSWMGQSDVDLGHVMALPLGFSKARCLRILFSGSDSKLKPLQDPILSIIKNLQSMKSMQQSFQRCFEKILEAERIDEYFSSESSEYLASQLGEASLDSEGVYKFLFENKRKSEVTYSRFLKEIDQIMQKTPTVFVPKGWASALRGSSYLNSSNVITKQKKSNSNAITPYYEKKFAGFKLVGATRPGSPVVQVHLIFRGGLSLESTTSNGISYLLESIVNFPLFQKYLMESVDVRLKGLLVLNAFYGKDAFGFSCNGPANCVAEILSLLKNTWNTLSDLGELWEPLFNQVLLSYDASKLSEPEYENRGLEEFFLKVFAPDHPYQLPFEGNKKSLAQQSLYSLQEFLTHMSSFEACISVVGPQTQQETERLLQNSSLKTLFRGTKPAFRGVNWVPNRKVFSTLCSSDASRAHVIVGAQAFSAQSLYKPRQDVLFQLFEGGSGYLYQRLRVQEGLVYDIAIGSRIGQLGGAFYVSFSCESNKLAVVRNALVQALEELPSFICSSDLDKFKKKTLYRSRSRLVGTQSLGLEIGLYGLYGIGLNEIPGYIDKVQQIEVDDILDLWNRLGPSETWTRV